MLRPTASTRLIQAAQYGFQGIEIVEDDVESEAAELSGGITDNNRLEAAQIIRNTCDKLGLAVIVFQPFRFYEGLLNRQQHEVMIQKLHLWLGIA